MEVVVNNIQKSIQKLNALLEKKKPKTFNAEWINQNSKSVYTHLLKNFQTESGGVDWDSITNRLEPTFQKRWKCYEKRVTAVAYENREELDIILSSLVIKVHPQAIKWYVERSWGFSYQTIWYRCLLNDEEICEIKNQIGELYQSIPADNFKVEAEIYFQQFSKQIEVLRIKKGLSRPSLFVSFKTLMQEIGNPLPEKSVYLNRLFSRARQFRKLEVGV